VQLTGPDCDKAKVRLKARDMGMTGTPSYPQEFKVAGLPGITFFADSWDTVMRFAQPWESPWSTQKVARRKPTTWGEVLKNVEQNTREEHCPECWGTGFWHGMGAPCSRGCSS